MPSSSISAGRSQYLLDPLAQAALAPARVEFAGAAQVRRTVTRKGKKTVDVVYLITSSDADPATLAAWVRDVTYQEDRSLVRTGNAPRVMASLRSLAISPLPPTGTTPAIRSGRSSS